MDFFVRIRKGLDNGEILKEVIENRLEDLIEFARQMLNLER